MQIVPLTKENRQPVDRDIVVSWGGPLIVSNGETYDTSCLPGFLALDDENRPLGYAVLRLAENACELAVFGTFIPNHGAGAALIPACLAFAKEHNASRLWLVTTNDNTRAIRFYQKNGFTLSAVRIGQLELSRKQKPDIPLYGIDGIPLRDEFELEIRILC